MKERLLFTAILAAGLWLPTQQALAQFFTGAQYISGTAGLQAGTLPSPGFYFDDINFYGYSSILGGAVHASTYVNEPRFRWMTKKKLLGANYGMELMIPWLYQDQTSDYGPGPRYSFTQFEVYDLEISPLLLSWHEGHFDFSAGYALWIPTADNSAIVSHGYVEGFPAQTHYWDNMLSLGGTWHPDAGRKWSVSALNHYEISQSYKTGTIPRQQGQQFTMEWGVSRTIGSYFEVGAVGNYSRQTTDTRVNTGPFYGNQYFPGFSNVEVGPEIKFTVPHCDFSASLRYLHDFSTERSFDLDVVALSLSKRF